jgi:hypothetical protein
MEPLCFAFTFEPNKNQIDYALFVRHRTESFHSQNMEQVISFHLAHEPNTTLVLLVLPGPHATSVVQIEQGCTTHQLSLELNKNNCMLLGKPFTHEF